MIRTIALAYSGGLDTSVIVPWLKERYDARVICVAADIGQGDELAGVRAKAIASGAEECYVEDLRQESGGLGGDVYDDADRRRKIGGKVPDELHESVDAAG